MGLVQVCSCCKNPNCHIYLENYRSQTMYFEEFAQEFHEEYFEQLNTLNKDIYGVQPLFNPFVTHLNKNEYLQEELLKKGIDHMYCQFYGENGCIIDEKNRPFQCQTLDLYMCENALKSFSKDGYTYKNKEDVAPLYYFHNPQLRKTISLQVQTTSSTVTVNSSGGEIQREVGLYLADEILTFFKAYFSNQPAYRLLKLTGLIKFEKNFKIEE